MWKQLRYSRQRSEWKVYIIAIRLAGKSSFLGECITLKIFFPGQEREQCCRGIPSLSSSVVSSSIFVSTVRPIGPLKAPRTVKSADPVCFWCNTNALASTNALRPYRRPYACDFSHARRRNPSARWKMMGSTRDKVFARCNVYTGCFEYISNNSIENVMQTCFIFSSRNIDFERERNDFSFRHFFRLTIF